MLSLLLNKSLLILSHCFPSFAPLLQTPKYHLASITWPPMPSPQSTPPSSPPPQRSAALSPTNSSRSPQRTRPSSPPPQQSVALSPTNSTRSPVRPPISLEQPSKTKNRSNSNKMIKRMQTAFRSFPIISPACRIPGMFQDGHVHGGTRVTGTLYGQRKARVNLAIQENPRCLPMLVLELAIPTGKLLQDMGVALVRVALECEKNPSEKSKLIEEPVWTMYCNGRKTGYGIKREPNEDDLHVMQMLHVVSMGAGVLPSIDETESSEGELTYMRSHFERVVGSKDSETYYMMNPDGSNGPELSIFFVRV